MNYFSFLICFHQRQTDIYLSGKPIGTIRDGEFHLHQVTTSSGNLRDITMQDLKSITVGGCPFDTLDELKAYVSRTIEVMQIPSPGKP